MKLAEWIAARGQAARAVCEWSEGGARGRLKYEIGLQHMCEVKRNTRNRLPAGGK